MKTTRSLSTQKLVLGAILTALVLLLQYMGSFIKFGPFSISLVLIPIVIGAATCGTGIATWLGFVFGFAVLISGDAAVFLSVTIPGTIISVLLKGILCGLAASLAYNASIKLFGKFKSGQYIAVVISAIVCPIVNTGVFLICCTVFFMETITQWALAANLGGGVAHYMIFGLVGINFIAELVTNIVLSPIVTRLLKARNK